MYFATSYAIISPALSCLQLVFRQTKLGSWGKFFW